MDMERLIAAVYQESPLWDKRNKLHANPWSLTNAGKPLVNIWKLKVSFIVNLKIRPKKKNSCVSCNPTDPRLFFMKTPTLDNFFFIILKLKPQITHLKIEKNKKIKNG